MIDDTEISEKSKKSDILDAYHSVLEKLKHKETTPAREKMQRQEEEKVVKQSQGFSPEVIIKNLAETKTLFGKTMDSLEEKMLQRFRDFADLQRSVEISQRELQSIHQITIEADSLAAFLQAHKEKKEQLEEEHRKRRLDLEEDIAERKNLWEKEKQAFESSRKEEEGQLKLQRKREEENFQYELKLCRQKNKIFMTQKR